MVHLLHRLYGVDAPVRGCAKHLLHLLIPVLGLCHTSNGASDHAHNTRSTTLQFPRQLWGNWILVQHETLEVAVLTMRTLKGVQSCSHHHRQHTITQLLQAGCPSYHPINNKLKTKNKQT